uniref:F-box associated beta-propeller type 1 domain-containing protein n=1 Tax=Fagus sylvatica TaxID=28930 RepID=A0A2N9J4S8_FAGSY
MNEILPEDVVIQILKKKNCEDFLVHRLSYETLQQVSKTKPLPPPYPGIERYNKEKYDSAASMVSQNILPYSTLEEWIVMPLRMKKEAIPSMDFVIREYIGQLHVRLVGSVNGLVCLHDTHWHHVLIWNPATGETKVLPGNRLDYLPIDYCFGSIDVGFGFDAKTNDYKVIIVATTSRIIPLLLTSWCQCEVYSLNSNSWRRIDGIHVDILNHTYCRTYTNGMFSWYGACDKGYCLWSFDISNEVFLTTPLPDATDFEEKSGRASFMLNELVALAIYYVDTVLGSETCFDIWLLHEFGVEESWTKLITIGPLTQINRPLGFWKNDYSLFLENTDGQLVLYDFSTQEMTDLHIDGIPSSLQMLTYMESLVSVREERASRAGEFMILIQGDFFFCLMFSNDVFLNYLF